MTGFSGGFLRDDSGALVVVPFASAAAPTSMSESFVRDATGALVTGSTAPLAYAEGFVRDANLSLATVDVGSAVSPAMSQGFIRDSSGALVTVDEGSAVAPTGYSQGFVRDANYSLVTTGGGSSSQIAFVKAGGNSSTIGTVTSLAATVPAGGHAAGNMLVVPVLTGAATIATPSGVTDSKGNTYTVDNTLVGALAISVARSILATPLVAGDTITVTWAASTTLLIVDSAEFSGVSATPLDATASLSGGATTSLDGGTTATLAQAKEVAFGAFSVQGATGGSTPGAGWTELNDLTVGSGGSQRALVWEYQIVNSTAAVDATATIVTAHSHVGTTTTYKGA